MRIQGTVMWFDQRDGHGVLFDAKGSEYYTDSSVAPNDLKHGQKVSFEVNPNIEHTLCAYNVERN